MIGYQGYPLQCSSKSRTYDCFVTFLKVSDISIPLQSRSFPSAESPPPGSGRLPRRFLKLTTLYGTGQQEIGEFQISGDECDIEQRRSYQFDSSDSTSVTKLHIYVDEVCSSGLTGHVTIDLKDFIGENDSEVYLEYPLSASSPRQRAAKLKVVVRCTCTVDLEDGECPDMDLEAFLSDKFPQNVSELPHEVLEIEHLLRGPLDCKICAPDGVPEALHRAQEYLPWSLEQIKPTSRQNDTEIHILKNLEGNLVGFNTKLKQFVAEYAQTKSVFGQFKNEKTQSTLLSKSDLHAAIFFAAGVTIQKRLHSVETASKNTIVYLRTKSEDFDASRLRPSVDAPIAEVVTLGGNSCTGFDIDPFDIPECSSNSSRDESVRSTSNQGEGRDPDNLQGSSGCLRCPTCSTTESKLQDSCTFDCQLMKPAVQRSSSWRTTEAEETKPLVSTSATTSKQTRNVGLIIRNVLGVLLIAGVSFVLGAKGASLVGAQQRRSTDDNSDWTEIQQMGAWKEPGISQEHTVGQLEIGSNSMQNLETIASKLANKMRVPDHLREHHRKLIALRWPVNDEGSSTLSTPSQVHVSRDSSRQVSKEKVVSRKQGHFLVQEISREGGDFLQQDVPSMTMDLE